MNEMYTQLSRGIGSVPGVLTDSVEFGSFKVLWNVCILLIKYPINVQFVIYLLSELHIHRLYSPGILDILLIVKFPLIKIFKWMIDFQLKRQFFILHDGTEQPAREMMLAVGAWSYDLQEEIWVFNQTWQKDHNLWVEVQKADWDDVILEDDFKKNMQKDIYSFFDAKEIYKQLSLPWKVTCS